MSVPTYYRLYDLPWAGSAVLDERYRRILRNILAVFLVFGILVPLLPVVEKQRGAQPDIPERVVKLIVEQPKPPPPPPPKVVEPKPEVRLAKVEPKPVPPQPVDRMAEARKKAEKSGLMALKDDLADLRDNQLANTIATDRPLTAAVGDGPRVERSLITSKTGRGSGGINTAAMSRNVGSVGLAGRGTTKVQSNIAAMAAAEAVNRGGSGKPSRSREEIETVFDQNKGAIYALYSRALRRDPSLQGKLVLRLTILPSGTVADCEVLSTEINDTELLQKLVERVKMFRFLAKDVASITTTKPIDFFPA